MQGSLSSPQRLCLQSLAALQSYRTFGVNLVGLCSFLRWQALEKPPANNGVANASPLLETLKAKGVAFVGSTNMVGTSFASTPSCSYKTDMTACDFNRTIAASGKSCSSVQKLKSSCGILKPVQRLVALQWVSLHTQREYDRKPVGRVAGKTGGQDVLVKEEKFGFKRIVSESDSITTFYSSDFSSSSEDEEDEQKTKVAIEYEADSHCASDTDAVKGMDLKEAKKLKSLQKTEIDMSVLEECDDSDQESEDEKGEILTKEDKKIAKAELKQREKLEKAMKKDEKKQTKDAKKLVSEGKKDNESESDSESESDEEGAQRSREKTKTGTKLKADEDLASDSENEEADDGVTDFVDDDSEENLRITESELNDYVKDIDISDESEKELDDEDEDLDEDDDFWDDDDGDVVVGDGGAGGGVVLGGTKWGTNALDLAEQVVAEYGKDISIFSFKVSSDRVIRVRLDKLSDRYGSPTMTDIENFSRKFSTALEESGEAGNVPKDIDVEVSSPGAERVVRVPDDLQRFKKLPMYVQYLEGETDQDGVFELDSVDMDAGLSVWKIANVKLNREVKGRGRPLNNKQKKWRATVPFAALKQVRLYLDV